MCKLSINNHIVGLVHKNHVIRTRLMYHAACKVEFQPFKRLYSQLTFFNLKKKKMLFALSSFLLAPRTYQVCIYSTRTTSCQLLQQQLVMLQLYGCVRSVPSTRRHPAHPVSVAILLPREIQALWSQNHDTEILHTNVVSRVGNGMTCRRTGYDTYGIQMLAIQMR